MRTGWCTLHWRWDDTMTLAWRVVGVFKQGVSLLSLLDTSDPFFDHPFSPRSGDIEMKATHYINNIRVALLMRDRITSVLHIFILLSGMTVPCTWQMDRYILFHTSLLVIKQWCVLSLQYNCSLYMYLLLFYDYQTIRIPMYNYLITDQFFKNHIYLIWSYIF